VNAPEPATASERLARFVHGLEPSAIPAAARDEIDTVVALTIAPAAR